MQNTPAQAKKPIMALWKETFKLRLFGLAKIPMLFWVSPSLIKLSETECVIRIPLTWRTKNHLGGMYFGTLAVGADCAGGLIAMEAIRSSGKKVALIFKDFKADFLKRAEGDVDFACRDGKLIREQVQETLKTGQRVNRTVHILATTPKVSGKEPVAKFQLTLSLKALN